MKWQEGRQGTGYFKLKLFSWEPYFDAWLLKYPPGAHIPRHRDEVDGRRHWRCNIILKRAVVGGGHWVGDVFHHPACGKRITVFRPDVEEHGVLHVGRGTRYVLSLGFTLKGYQKQGEDLT